MNKYNSLVFLKKLTISALMIGLSVVLARFVSFYVPLGGMPSMRFGLGNLPVIIASLVCGPFWGMIVGASSDLIGSFAFPSGAYFFGYTIDSALTGLLPWIIMKFMKDKKKTEFFSLIALFCVEIALAISYLFTHEEYSNGKDSFKYEFPLTDSVRIGLTLGLSLLAVVSFSVIILFAKTIGREEKLLSVEKPEYEMFRGKKVCVNPDILKKKNGYSFFDIAIMHFTMAFLVSILLLPMWNQFAMGLPYYYGMFNNLIFMWIQGPVKILIYWVVLNALKKAGLMELSYEGKKRSYDSSSMNQE